MIWVVSYRRDERTEGERAAQGRAAAIIAAVGLLDRGIEVISVRDQHGMQSVSADEIGRVRELRDMPVVRSLFPTRRQASRRQGVAAL